MGVHIEESSKDLEHQLVRKPWCAWCCIRCASNHHQLDHVPCEWV